MEEEEMMTDGSDQNTKGKTNGNGNGNPMSDEERARRTLQSQIAGMAKEIERALPGKIGVERMMRIVMTAILKTPALAMCEPTTFFGALLQALQLGLEVNTPLGQAYLIPRRKNDKNGKFLYWECNFQLGYQGLLELCYRSQQYEVISARIVYDGDDFEHEYGSHQYLRHIPRHTSENPIFAYGYYKLKDGGGDFVVWKYENALKHGEEFSDAFNSKWAPWQKHAETQEAMVRKTMLKQVLKFAPKSVELAEASTADGHALLAGKYEDAGSVKLRFDVKQLEAPDQEAQEFMNQVNRAGNGQPEKETVPSTGSSATTPQQTQAAATTEGTIPAQPKEATAGIAPQSGNTGAVVRADVTNGSGKGRDQVFGADEDAAMQEAYERHMAGTLGPDFG
jgi:recombination protein RecT